MGTGDREVHQPIGLGGGRAFRAKGGSVRRESFFKLTNYNVIHRDLDLIRQLAARSWSFSTRRSGSRTGRRERPRAVKRIESEYAFVLTGTPLENRLEELHSIVEFVDRFRLGPMFRFLPSTSTWTRRAASSATATSRAIAKTLEPILLRRTKDKVLKELPERLDKRMFVPMTPEQMRHHEENREGVARIVAKWRRYDSCPRPTSGG